MCKHYYGTIQPSNWSIFESDHIEPIINIFVRNVGKYFATLIQHKDAKRSKKFRSTLRSLINEFGLIDSYDVRKRSETISVVDKILHLYIYDKINPNLMVKVYAFDLHYWSLCTVPTYYLWKMLKSILWTGARKLEQQSGHSVISLNKAAKRVTEIHGKLGELEKGIELIEEPVLKTEDARQSVFVHFIVCEQKGREK